MSGISSCGSGARFEVILVLDNDGGEEGTEVLGVDGDAGIGSRLEADGVSGDFL